MAENKQDFDPYHKWLGIQPKDQPPNHYRLLGVELFESDPDVIQDAAFQRMAHVRTYQLGKNSALSQRILNELAAAKVCLLNGEKKSSYDATLRARVIPVAPSPASDPLKPPSPAPDPLAAIIADQPLRPAPRRKQWWQNKPTQFSLVALPLPSWLFLPS